MILETDTGPVLRLWMPDGESPIEGNIATFADLGVPAVQAVLLDLAGDNPGRARDITKALWFAATGDERHRLTADPETLELVDAAELEIPAAWAERLEQLVREIDELEPSALLSNHSFAARLDREYRNSREAWITLGVVPAAAIASAVSAPRSREHHGSRRARSPGAGSPERPPRRPDRLARLLTVCRWWRR